MKPTADNAGASITGISIFGDKTSTNVNNAIAFYDRNNFAVVRDFEAFYLNGSCLLIGHTKNLNRAYTRESLFYNIRCNNTGTTSTAAVDVSATTVAGDDATNELQFHGLNIFGSPGVGLAVRNPNNFATMGNISFYGLRVEFSGDDNVDIGSSTDAGQVAGIRVYGLESLTPGQTNAGKYALNIDTGGVTEYAISVNGGQIGPCWNGTSCKGVNIGNVRLSRVQLDNIATVGTNVTYGANVGNFVLLDGNGVEKNWTYSFAAGTSRVNTPAYFVGDPTTK